MLLQMTEAGSLLLCIGCIVIPHYGRDFRKKLTGVTLHHFTILTVLLVALLSGCSQPPDPAPNYHEYAYVTNGGSNTVTVVDLRSLSVLKTIAVGRSPTGVAANPRRNEIYV